MKNYLLACLALQISLCAQAQSEKSPLDPIYAVLQRTAPAPAMRPIPDALSNSCSPRAAEIRDELAFESGTAHYMLDQLYVWHTYLQLDGSLCGYLDLPAPQMLTRNDVQALETVSWLRTPQVPSGSIDDGLPIPRAVSPDFVRSFSQQPCEADAAPVGNVMMITPSVGITTAALANMSGASQGCVYSAVQDTADPQADLRRIDLVRKGIGAGATGLSDVAFVELQEAARVQTPPYRFFGNSSSNPNNIVPRTGDFGAAIVQTDLGGFTFPGTFEYVNGKLNVRQIVQPSAPSGCPGLTTPPAIFGGALVIDLEAVTGVVSSVSAACLGGSLAGIYGVNRYGGERLTASEFTKFQSFVAESQPALAIHLFEPKEFTTIDISLPSTQLGCNGPSVTSEIAWRSSVISPITGSYQVGTGCYIPANRLARGTQILTVYRSTDPRRKSSVKVTAIKAEALVNLSQTGDYVLPLGSYSLNLQINWNSQDVGSHVFLTEQIDNNTETLITDVLYGSTSRQIGAEHVAKYRLRRATANYALSGAVLDEKSVTVLRTAVVPLETPTMVTYPFGRIYLPFPSLSAPIFDCPSGICTFVLRWLSDGSFGVEHEIKQRRLDHCDTFTPYACTFEPWVDLPLTTGSSRVITFAARFGQEDRFEFKIRACAPFRGCSDWSVPVTSVEETLYSGSISAVPTTATWVSTNGSCRDIPPVARPTLTLQHNYPFQLALMNFNFRASVEEPYGSYVFPGISTTKITNFGFITLYAGSFWIGFSGPTLGRINFDLVTTPNLDGTTTCRYMKQ